MKFYKKLKHNNIIALSLIVLAACLCSPFNVVSVASSGSTQAVELEAIPTYSNQPYVEINNNEPNFTEQDMTTESFESYSELDSLGRCGAAEASIGKDIMPTEKRGKIGQIKPAGWHTVKYAGVDGRYLYNRCHLIGFQLAGENANEKNLITGTRYMNVEGMLPFEDEIADYVKETNHHVMYRVTPVYEGSNLVASGVQMEAESVEDGQIQFNVYVYNAQPDVTIDYATGNSRQSGEQKNTVQNESKGSDKSTEQYVLNKNTNKFHKQDCASVADIKPQNKENLKSNRDELLGKGYEPCKRCNP